MYKYNDRVIREGNSWTDDEGYKHPANWNVWSPEYKAAMGLVWEDDPVVEPVFQSFEEARSVVQSALNGRVEDALKDTDWYYLREMDSGEKVPKAVKAKRTAIRRKADKYQTRIDNATIVAELLAIDFDFNITTEELAAYIPTQVSMRQARLALQDQGLLKSVEMAITDPKDRIQWEYAQVVKRDDALVRNLGAALGLSGPQLDALFVLAASM